MEAAIHARGLCKRFGQRWALAHVSFTVPAGSTVLLTGENGAGKTTLLRILATALRPSLGTVQWYGAETGDVQTVRLRLSLFTHHTYHYDDLSALENLDLVRRLKGRPDNGAMEETLRDVGLWEHRHRPVGAFSAGMKRRLGFAKTSLGEPDLLLLDEPFGQLDGEGVEMVERLIKRFQSRNATIVLSTHDIERGAALCDTQLPMAGGSLTHPHPQADLPSLAEMPS